MRRFPRLDPLPGNLDLVVDPAEEVQDAVLALAHTVPRPVGGPRNPRNLAEALSGPLGVVHVSAADARPRDPELSRLAGGDRRGTLVEHVELVVGERRADRNRPLLPISDHMARRDDRRLRGAVDVEESHLGMGGAQLGGGRGGKDVATGRQDPHPAQLGQGATDELGQHPGREHRDTDLALGDQRADVPRVRPPGGNDDDPAPAREGRPDLESGEVEAERGDVEHSLAGLGEQLPLAAQEVDEAAMGDRHPFRGSGRAGGEEDVGEPGAPLRRLGASGLGCDRPLDLGRAERRAGARELDQRLPALRWVGGVEGDVGASRPLDAEKGADRLP